MPRRAFRKEELEHFPRTYGVYLFFDGRGKPVYVGKATDLRSRVRSYFGQSDHRLVTSLVHQKAETMDFIVTESAKEALLLENSLIKKHAPLLNIRLKDDSTYFSLKLDLAEEWPRLRIVRKRKKEEALYFGPYPSAHACRKTIQFINALFPIRTCPDAVLHNRTRPCIAFEIKRCKAPCVGLVDRPSYIAGVQRIIDFLSGRDAEVVAGIEAEMEAAAERLDFERAAELRDRLAHVTRTLEQPQVAKRGGPDRDILGFHEGGDEMTLAVMNVRDGALAGSGTWTFKTLGRDPDEMLAAFIGQYYGPERPPAPEVLLPREAADLELHREILEEKLGQAVVMKVPERGEGLRLQRLADRNAELSHVRAGEAKAEDEDALTALVEKVGLQRRPTRMECYDISHFSGSQVVGSRVSFHEGRPDKAHYRHYKLKEVQRNDDFAAMDEVLTRRIRRGQRENDLPDLIVIDGGRPQLERIASVFESLKVQDVDLIGLAKARREGRARSTEALHERVWLPGAAAAIPLEDNAPETKLLARIRDEAHRFAITYSRRLRGKETIGTVLEMIPGIGRQRAKALLSTIGSVKAIKACTPDELCATPGVTPALAQRILEWFAEHADAGAGLGAELPEEEPDEAEGELRVLPPDRG